MIAATDDWAATFDNYVAGVIAGTVVASQRVRAACQRHLDDLERAKSDDWPFYFDAAAANQPCDFISLLTLNTGRYANKPFELFPWQVFCLRSIYGWRHKSTKFRRFRSAYISVARGNGKSPLAAANLVFTGGFDSPMEQRAENFCAATTRAQARIVFADCVRFRDKSKEIKGLSEAIRDKLTFTHTDSTIIPLGSDSTSTDGLVPHNVVFDEYHALKEQHRPLVEKLDSAMHKRDQPLMLVITTAGDDNSQLWLELYSECCAVVDRGNGLDNDHLFAFIAEIDPEDDPFDPEVWPKANPMLGHGVVTQERIQAEADKVDINPARRLPFIRYYCNRLVTSSDKPITAKMWARCNGPLPDDLEGREAFGGFDWGWKDDLAALGWVFPLDRNEDGKRTYAVKAHVWIPEHCKHRSIHAEPWASWIEAGWLTVTPGDATQMAAVIAQLEADAETYDVQCVAFDEYKSRDFGQAVDHELGLEVFAFRQNCAKYHEPLTEFVEALNEGRICHGGNPLLAWCASNMVTKSDAAGYLMPDKAKSQDKIDPIAALVMAISEAMFRDQQSINYYEENDVDPLI